MIVIIKNTEKQITFKKETPSEVWFNGNCSDENILINCKRTNDKIDYIKFDDGSYIGSILHVYFKNK